MAVVAAHQLVRGGLAETEARWYDTGAWPRWMDGLDRVAEVTGEWPAPGATVTWESNPAGRGLVTERVLAHATGAGQTVEVTDGSLTGHQRVTFTPVADGTEVDLELRYRLLRRSPVSALIDVLFIRRAMTASLERTLDRFAARAPAAGDM